jgi:hypothetical protein
VIPRCEQSFGTPHDVVRRTGLDVRFRCELFTGRRAEFERLRDELERLS